MISRRYNILFTVKIFIVLPIVLGARLYHGYDSYQEYYDNRVNNEQLKPVSFPKKTAREERILPFSGLPLGDVKYSFEKKFVFPDVKFQIRNTGDNSNAEVSVGPVAMCDFLNQTFCEDVPNYPTEFVNRALLMNSTLMHYAHEDIIAIVPRLDTDDETLCLSTEQVIRPKAAENMQNKWLYILQSNQTNFHQSIRVETCQEVNAKCKLIDDVAEGYVTSCKQKYIYRELSAISEDGEIIRDYFRFPASCCCHVQFQANNGNTK